MSICLINKDEGEFHQFFYFFIYTFFYFVSLTSDLTEHDIMTLQIITIMTTTLECLLSLQNNH